ncbi:odorant receptor 131-2-like [Xenentodon cancila]
MSFSNQTNITAELQRQTMLWVVFSSVASTLPCCVFLFINGTMLFTLRSKAVFLETSRYILLYNLLFSDTVQLAHNQVMFLMSGSRVTMLYYICAALTAFNSPLHGVSILTLVLMCLERYVAVCFPLRHAAVITVRNTGMAIAVIWTFSSINALIQLSLMLNISFKKLQDMQMKDYCGKDNLLLEPLSDVYDKASIYFLYVLTGFTVTFSYIGIIVAATSASTDKASATKARKTLLLHLLQLGLSLSSTVFKPMVMTISKNVDRVIIVRIQIIIYICIIILPKCLSSLIYGLRDQTIRPVLMFNLGCQWRGSSLTSVIQTNTKIGILFT